MEIERKFLVKTFNSNGLKGEKVVQVYASLKPELRIRLKADKAYLTLKSEGDLEREELEAEIDFNIAAGMVKHFSHRIEKTRYTIGRWEVDIYEGRLQGLIVAEVELEHKEEELPEPPGGLELGKEVTEDKRFKNKNLAVSEGIPEIH